MITQQKLMLVRYFGSCEAFFLYSAVVNVVVCGSLTIRTMRMLSEAVRINNLSCKPMKLIGLLGLLGPRLARPEAC